MRRRDSNRIPCYLRLRLRYTLRWVLGQEMTVPCSNFKRDDPDPVSAVFAIPGPHPSTDAFQLRPADARAHEHIETNQETYPTSDPSASYLSQLQIRVLEAISPICRPYFLTSEVEELCVTVAMQ